MTVDDEVSLPHVVVEETEPQRLDREHDQLYGELRSLITGVQVLFAFLLSLAFTDRFHELSNTDRTVHIVVMVCAACSLILLLAPTAFHRVRFRQRDKETLVRLANAEAITAMALMSLAIGGSLYLVVSLTLGHGWAIAIGGVIVVVSAAVWWGVPLERRRRHPDD